MTHAFQIDKTLVPVDAMRGDDLQDTHLLNTMLEEATAFIASFHWSGTIRERWFGLGVGGVVAVFLFRINPSEPDVDDYLWIVVGDLPPAYLVTDGSPTARDALATYVAEISRWVSSARSGNPTDDVIPVNVPPTKENADLLERRLTFIRENFLSE